MTTPTPLVRASRCAMALLTLGCLATLAAAAAGALPTQWARLSYAYQNKTYVFFYPKSEKPFPGHDGNERLTLFRRPIAKAAQQARSYLFKASGETAYKLHLVDEGGTGSDIEAAATGFQLADYAPAASAPALPAAAPKGVDPAVWQEVRTKYASGLSTRDAVALARTLTAYDKANPGKRDAARTWLSSAAGNPAKLAAAARAGGPAAASGRLSSWVAGAMSGGVAASDAGPGGAPPGAAVPGAGPGQQMGDVVPIQPILDAIKGEAEAEDIAKRITEWVWAKRPEGHDFVSPDARGHEADLKPMFEGVLKTAVAAQGTGSLRGPAGLVYDAIGPGDKAPAWVSGDPKVRALLVENRGKYAGMDDKLALCLDRWQYDPKGGKSSDKDCFGSPVQAVPRVPLSSEKYDEWIPAFLIDASKQAAALISQVNKSTSSVRAPIDNASNTGPTVPGNGMGPRIPSLPTPALASFGIDQLFGKWGDRNVFYLNGRVLALVIRTNQDFKGDPPQAVLTQQLGLYDISNPSDIYGKRFDMSNGAQSFPLIPGGHNYNISLVPQGNDVKISITGDGDAKPQFGSASQDMPSLNQMYQIRAQNALASGNRVNIAGRTYLVTGEASSTGNLLFWDEKDLLSSQDAINGNDPGLASRYWVPTMMAKCSEMRDGRPQNLSNQVALGLNVNNEWYGLRWNQDTGQWDPAKGDQFKPSVPPPATSTGTAAGGTPTGAPTGGTPGGTAPQGPSARPGTADALNKKLSADAAKRVIFVDHNEATQFGQYVALCKRKADGSMDDHTCSFPMYPGLDSKGNGANDLSEDILLGRYLITKSDKGDMFMDLMKYDFVANSDGSGKITGQAGSYAFDGGFQGVTDREVLKAVMGFAAYEGAATNAALANLDKARNGSDQWVVNGPKKSDGGPVMVIVDNRHCAQIYPRFVNTGGCSGDAAPGSVPGTGAGFQMDPASPTELPAGETPFQASIDLQSGGTVNRVDPKPADAGLYVGTIDGKNSWYLEFVATDTGSKPPKRTKFGPSLIFQEGSDHRMSPPSGVQVGGVAYPGAGGQLSLMPIRAGTSDLSAKGAIGAYRSANNDSCVGVVAWWGINKEEACGLCGKWKDGACYPFK